MKYYIIAGEASGDLHGSNLMKGLYHEDPEADIRFWGGDLMNDVYKAHQSGTGLVQDYKDGAIIGFVQVLLKAKTYFNRFKKCFADILEWNPDVVILIDYPGFNCRVRVQGQSSYRRHRQFRGAERDQNRVSYTQQSE